MSTIQTTTTATAWSPDDFAFGPREAIPDALINHITTPMGSVEGDDPVVRVAVVDDDEAAIVPEGTEIAEGTPDLAEVLIGTVKVAKLLRVSREQFTQSQTSTNLSEAAQRSIAAKADQVLLNQPPPAPGDAYPPAGLLAQGMTDAGEVAGLDDFIDILAGVQANGASPTSWLLAPETWAAIQKWKTGEGSSVPLLGAGATATNPLLLSVPVLVNKAVPAGTGVLLDKRDIASVAGGVFVAQSKDHYFSFDSIGLRVTFRFGATLIHPERHTMFEIG